MPSEPPCMPRGIGRVQIPGVAKEKERKMYRLMNALWKSRVT